MGTLATSPHIWFILLLAIYAGHYSEVAAECSHQCTPQSSVLKYQKGHTYTYNLEGSTVTSLSGTQDDPVRLKLRATAELSIVDDCNKVLRLRGVQVQGPDSKNYGNLKDLEAHSVLANYKGGVINSQLCSEDGENQSGLNIKRAILSLLQIPDSRTSSTREVDVFGDCPTNLRYSQRGDVTIISKSRDLNKCAYRENLKQEILSTQFAGQSELHSTPFLDAELDVEQQLKNGLIVSAVSQETYFFRPFSNRGNGARTVVQTKLTLVTNGAKAPPDTGSFNIPRQITFEAPHSVGGVAGGSSALTSALHGVQGSMKEGVTADAASKFRSFVGVLKQSSVADILKVYNDVKAGAGFGDKKAARKLLLDGILRTGTGEAAEVIVTLLKNKEIDSTLWYKNLAFIQHSSLSSIVSVSSLLDQRDVSIDALLGVGSLIGRYCREHSCENVAEFDKVLAKYTKHLDKSISTKSAENHVIAALKSLANIHHLNDNVGEKVKQLAVTRSLPPRVRVAALETIQSDPCRRITKEAALGILGDHLEDSEIRIKAYLAVVECPCNHVVSTIRDLLENEPINQVGSFVVSHLKNLQASTNPAKAAAKEKLGLLKPRKQFSADIRKYSHNYELSYIIDAWNAGASLESNVIFSQSSYLPRSVSLNVTAELFGHSYNLFEVGARTENLDHIIESYFGPKGYILASDEEEIVENSTRVIKTLANKIKDRYNRAFRNKRSISKDAIESIRQEARQTLLPSQRDRTFNFDLSFKTFGSEIAWFNGEEGDKDFKPSDFIDKIFDSFTSGIEGTKKFDYDLKPHYTFLDTELAYPTGLGFPLKLVIAGSFAARLRLNGDIDLERINKDPLNTDFRFLVVPSAAVEVSGKFVVDAYAVESGLKVDYTLHSSTGISVAAKALDGQGIDVQVGLPIENQEVINVKTEVLTTLKEKGHSEVTSPLQFSLPKKDYKEYHWCFEQLSPINGLTFCGEVSVPWSLPSHESAFYPLNGPSKLSLKIEANDVSEYHFRAQLIKEGDKSKSLEILFDTPNSKTNRKLLLQLQKFEEPHKQIKAIFNSPWKQLTAEATLVDDSNERSLTAKLLHDREEYFVKGGVKVSGNANHQTYTPLLEYRTPATKSDVKAAKSVRKSEGYTVSGSVIVDKEPELSKYTFRSVSLKTPKGSYTLNGQLEHSTNSYSADLKLILDKTELSVKSHLKHSWPESIDFGLETSSPQYHDLGFNLQWVYLKKPDLISNKLNFVHGKDTKSFESGLSIDQLLKYRFETLKDFHIETKNLITCPPHGVDVKFNGLAEPKILEYELAFAYDKYKVSSDLNVKADVKSPGDYQLSFSAHALDNSIYIESSRDVKSKDESSLINILHLKPGGTYKLVSQVVHVYEDENNINVKLDNTFEIEGKALYKLYVGYTVDPHLVNAQVKASVGDEDRVDAFFKFNRGNGNPNGNAKLFVKQYIDGTATFKYNNGLGTGTLQIDIPKLNRKIKATGDATLTGTQCTGSLDLYWDADRDQSKKLHFKTENDFKQDSLSSRSTFSILEYTTVLNFEGALSGKLNDGKLSGNSEIIFPSGRHLTAKFIRNLHARQTNSEGDLSLEVADYPSKNSQPHKLELEINAKNVDVKNKAFEGDARFLLRTASGNDLKLESSTKHVPQGDKWLASAQFTATGTMIGRTTVVKVNSEIDKTLVTYNLNVDCSQGTRLNIAGKLNRGYSPLAFKQIENTIELYLPFDKLKHLKHTIDGTLSSQAESPLEFTVSNIIVWNNENTVKLVGEASGNKKEGRTKWDLVLPKEEPRSLETSWANNGDNKKAGALSFKWGNNKEAKILADVELTTDSQPRVLNVKATSPTETYGNLDLSLNLQKSETPAEKVEGDFSLTTNGKKIDVKGSIGLAPGVPQIDITVNQPSGTSKVYLNILKKNEQEAQGSLQLQWVAFGGGAITADGEIKLDPDDFHLKMTIDSPKLSIENLHLEAGHRQAKGNKRIVFSANSNGKNLFSGSTSLRRKSDAQSSSYEGNGRIQIAEKDHVFKFQLSNKNLLKESDNEVGFEHNLKMEVVGLRTSDFKLKVTDKELHVLLKQCATGQKGCPLVEIRSKFNSVDMKELEHQLTVTVDLKSLDVKHGLQLTAETVKKDFWSVDQQASLTLSGDGESTYKYKAYLKETGTGVTLTLPSRVIAAEVKVVPEQVKHDHWKQQISASFWLDKNRLQNSVSSILLSLEEIRGKDTIQFSGVAKFTHPNIPKDLTVKGDLSLGLQSKLLESYLEIDIFKQKAQKFIISGYLEKQKIENGYKLLSEAGVKSEGHHVDIVYKSEAAASPTLVALSSELKYKKDNKVKESELMIEVSIDKFVVHAKVPNHHLLHIEANTKKQNNLPVIDATLLVIGLPKTVIHFEATKNDLAYYKGSVYSTGTPNKKIEFSGGINGGIGLQADAVLDSNKKELFHFFVSTKGEEFLKPSFKWSSENIESVLEDHKNDLQEIVSHLQDVTKETADELSNEIKRLTDSLKNSQPNFKGFLRDYKNQLNALKNEIANDKVLKEISENLKEVIGDITDALTTLVNGILVTIEALTKTLLELQESILEALKKTVPAAKESFNKVVDAMVALTKAYLQQIVNAISTIAEILKKHEAEIQEYFNLISDLLKDIGQLVSNTVHQFSDGIVDFAKVFAEQVKELPLYVGLKEKYEQLLEAIQQLVVSDDLRNFAQEIAITLKDSLPTPQLQEFVDAIQKYLDKVSRKQKIDNEAELKIIYEKAVEALKSVIELIKNELAGTEQTKGFPGIAVPLALPTFLQFPRLATIRLSPVLYVFANGLPSLTELYNSYRPSLNIFDELPPYTATGILLDSHHIFTFDKRHLTFQGACSYILAQDVQDGNFTIVANLEGGSLKSIIVSDHATTVELSSDNSLLVNGKPTEYPAYEGDFNAWREYYRVGITSKAGVKVLCEIGINLCIFEIDGFYFGKTRGLLGTINNEPWDDFTKPDGQVATKANEFGNAWKINSQCADVNAVDHHEHNIKIEECDEVFSSSTVRPGAIFIDPEPYKEACRHIAHEAGTEEGRKQASCKAAAAYVRASYLENVILSLPPECAHCTPNGGSPVEVGGTFSVKVPQKSADVLILLEQVIGNAETIKDFVSPIVSQLTNELRTRGINDVRISLLGYGGPNQEWPSHYTSSGGKLIYDGKPRNFKLGERSHFGKFPDNVIDFITWLIDVDEKITHFVRTVKEIATYPFRPNAAKAIIAVTDSTCPSVPLLKLLPLLQVRNLLGSPGIVLHRVTPLENLQNKHVVGFDSEHLYQTGEGKKKQVSEVTGDARRTLKYEHTPCIDGALATSGIIFNKDNLKQHKKFIAQRIADSLSNVELTADCTCLPFEGIHARSVCAVTGSREKEQLTKGVKGTKGTKG